jgi:hypothetical protein
VDRDGVLDNILIYTAKVGIRRETVCEIMKTTALESFRVLESVLFWGAALPSALVAWPVLIFADKTKNLFRTAATPNSHKHLTPRVA